MFTNDKEENALIVAYRAHYNQRRKYTEEPYIAHCINVASLVDRHTSNTSAMYCAALLHDVVEDTHITLEDLVEMEDSDRLPDGTAALVRWLTDVSTKEDGNRETRKRLDREHIAKAPPDAKTIKLADLIDNTKSIISRDPEFAKVYMAEKRLLLEVLTGGDATLYAMAKQIVDDYYATG